MHARNVLLFVSILLPVIGAPVATNEVRSLLSFDQSIANVSKINSIQQRDPLIERIPAKAVSDVVFETKRDVDTEDTLAVRGDVDEVEEEEDDVTDLEVDSSEVDPTRRGLDERGITRHKGNGKRGITRTQGNGRRGITRTQGNGRRGITRTKGNGKRGITRTKGNGKKRGITRHKGNGKRSLVARTLGYLFG